MPFIDFVTLPKLKLEEGVYSQLSSSGNLSLELLSLKGGTKITERVNESERWIYVLDGQLEFYLGNKREVLVTGMASHITTGETYRALALTECKCIDISVKG